MYKYLSFLVIFVPFFFAGSVLANTYTTSPSGTNVTAPVTGYATSMTFPSNRHDKLCFRDTTNNVDLLCSSYTFYSANVQGPDTQLTYSPSSTQHNVYFGDYACTDVNWNGTDCTSLSFNSRVAVLDIYPAPTPTPTPTPSPSPSPTCYTNYAPHYFVTCGVATGAAQLKSGATGELTFILVPVFAVLISVALVFFAIRMFKKTASGGKNRGMNADSFQKHHQSLVRSNVSTINKFERASSELNSTLERIK